MVLHVAVALAAIVTFAMVSATGFRPPMATTLRGTCLVWVLACRAMAAGFAQRQA